MHRFNHLQVFCHVPWYILCTLKYPLGKRLSYALQWNSTHFVCMKRSLLVDGEAHDNEGSPYNIWELCFQRVSGPREKCIHWTFCHETIGHKSIYDKGVTVVFRKKNSYHRKVFTHLRSPSLNWIYKFQVSSYEFMSWKCAIIKFISLPQLNLLEHDTMERFMKLHQSCKLMMSPDNFTLSQFFLEAQQSISYELLQKRAIHFGNWAGILTAK